MRETFALAESARIVGLGNTPEDMIAYRAAGLEPVLALWGVPTFARDYACAHWDQDHVFSSMTQFLNWVEASRGPDTVTSVPEDIPSDADS